LKTPDEIRDLIRRAKSSGWSSWKLANALDVSLPKLARLDSWDLGYERPTGFEERRLDVFEQTELLSTYHQHFVSELNRRIANELKSNVWSATVQGLYGPTQIVIKKQ
jgi:hypothetical protein